MSLLFLSYRESVLELIDFNFFENENSPIQDDWFTLLAGNYCVNWYSLCKGTPQCLQNVRFLCIVVRENRPSCGHTESMRGISSPLWRCPADVKNMATAQVLKNHAEQPESPNARMTRPFSMTFAQDLSGHLHASTAREPTETGRPEQNGICRVSP